MLILYKEDWFAVAGRYRILVEHDNAFDYNAVYAEGPAASEIRANGVNGRPSVVYAAHFVLGGARTDDVAMVAVGTGRPAGSDGTV